MKSINIMLGGQWAPAKCYHNCKFYAVTLSPNPYEYTYTVTFKKFGVKAIAVSNKLFAISICNWLNRNYPNPYLNIPEVKDKLIEFCENSSYVNFHIRSYNC